MAEITRQVGASSDDAARNIHVTPYFDLTATYEFAGVDDFENYYGSGMRFTNLTIPKGENINQAYLIFRCFRSRAGTVCNTRISAEKVDDAPTFADNAGAFDARWANRTIARVDWDAIPAWTGDADYNSPDIKTVIKEIVDREGWASGQDIVIFWEDFEARSDFVEDCYREGYSYDSSPTYAPKLVINYGVPGWTGKVSGVTNPAKIMGVDVANIAKVKGVA